MGVSQLQLIPDVHFLLGLHCLLLKRRHPGHVQIERRLRFRRRQDRQDHVPRLELGRVQIDAD